MTRPSCNAKPCCYPDHLLQKMAISFWSWNWISATTPGESFDDLERCVIELKARGFNAIRIEAGLNWAFATDGKPRGAIKFKAVVPGLRLNASSGNAKGGGRFSVLDRLLRLFELAREHDVWIILTSWEYQNSTAWFVADPAIREEVFSVPQEARFMHLARQHDTLLRILKSHGLANRIAFVEIHNEPEYSEFPQGEPARRLHEEAIAFLRAQHADLLVAGDYASHDYGIFPDNAQIFNQHIYAGAGWYFGELYGKTALSAEFDPENPRALPALDRLLKPDFMPYREFMDRAESLSYRNNAFASVYWLYDNIDNAKWDEWQAESFSIHKAQIFERARILFAGDAAEAERRGLPIVLGEGGYFTPPLGARFELSPEGLALPELMIDLAIQHGYWGAVPFTQCSPAHPIWRDNPEWLLRTNRRFLNG